MIYELRTYKAMPGRMPDLLNRFSKITLSFFEKYNMKVVGFWQPLVGNNSELIYLLAFEDMAHYERAWRAFKEDPDWLKARAETEKNGTLVEYVNNIILTPTSFSPVK
jgi:hypothetical protein